MYVLQTLLDMFTRLAWLAISPATRLKIIKLVIATFIMVSKSIVVSFIVMGCTKTCWTSMNSREKNYIHIHTETDRQTCNIQKKLYTYTSMNLRYYLTKNNMWIHMT